MSEPSLSGLEALRDRQFARLAATGDFRRGPVTVNYRRCGKPNCACAAPEHPGRSPRFLWTRTEGRGKRAGRQLAAEEAEKVPWKSGATQGSWYHCAECKHGLAPRDAELGVAGTSLSPGLSAMTDTAAAAGPSAKAAVLLGELAGIALDVKRVERSAEASGAARSAAVRERAAATPPARSSRCPRTPSRTCSTPPSTAPASP